MLVLGASLGTTSFNTYRRPWQLFRQFCSDRLHIQGPIFPISTEQMALFITFLAEQKYFASTVLTYISALSFNHRLASLPDPTEMEMIQLGLRGYNKMNSSQDTRLPVSLPHLERIISASEHTQSSVYSREMTQAMYAMAFFAALRVGEITCRPTRPRVNVMFLNQIVFMKKRDGVVSAIKVTFRNYRHSDLAVPVDVFLYREKPVCLVSTVLAYLGLKSTSPGPLFCWPDAALISLTFFY